MRNVLGQPLPPSRLAEDIARLAPVMFKRGPPDPVLLLGGASPVARPQLVDVDHR